MYAILVVSDLDLGGVPASGDQPGFRMSPPGCSRPGRMIRRLAATPPDPGHSLAMVLRARTRHRAQHVLAKSSWSHRPNHSRYETLDAKPLLQLHGHFSRYEGDAGEARRESK